MRNRGSLWVVILLFAAMGNDNATAAREDTGEESSISIAEIRNKDSFKLLCVGDSLTAGYSSWGTVFTPYGEVIESLSSGRVEVDTIGMSGWTSGDLLGALDAQSVRDVCRKKSVGLRTQLKAKSYQLVTLLIGTNDLGTDVSVATLFDNICQLREVILQHVPRVVLLTVPSSRDLAQIHELNRQIRQLVLEHQENTLLFDCHALFHHANERAQEGADDVGKKTRHGHGEGEGERDEGEWSEGEREGEGEAGEGGKRRAVFDFDRLHFTVYGSQLLGQKIYRQLVEEGALPLGGLGSSTSN
jgi:lysophospholipase L1-like esterase